MNADMLTAWFADADTCGWCNLSFALFAGHLNQSVTFSLDDPTPKAGREPRPPTLVAVFEDSEGPKESHTRTMLHLDPSACRDLAQTLTAYADAWETAWNAYEKGQPWDMPVVRLERGE